MIIVEGTVVARAGQEQALIELSREHARRSRHEPGCLAHRVLLDPEHPARVIFLEQWESEAALQAHFRVPESAGFVRSAIALTDGKPEIRIFEAQAIAVPGGPATR